MKHSKQQLVLFLLCLGSLCPPALFAQPSVQHKPYSFEAGAGITYYLSYETPIGFTLKAEYSFKNPRIHLALHAASVPRNKYLEYNGLSGEIGLALKAFSVGRLSGQVSKFYWGGDLCIGRQAYLIRAQKDYLEKYNWAKVMICGGIQLGAGRFVLDLGFPIGLQIARHGNPIVFQPTLTAGIRF